LLLRNLISVITGQEQLGMAICSDSSTYLILERVLAKGEDLGQTWFAFNAGKTPEICNEDRAKNVFDSAVCKSGKLRT
jgi:hypothetical protein